jgi:hypothetical protein
MPKIPLCLQCDEPVIVEDEEYVDRGFDRFRGEENLVHLGCYAAFTKEAEAEGSAAAQA